MALFPILEIEGSVQINDKTRLDGTKSFVSRGSSNITTLTIKPGSDASVVSVFDVDDSTLWYLDWKFTDWKVDIDSTNNKINFSEAETEYTATLSTGSYTLAQLLTEMKTQMDATAATGVFTITSDIENKITISSTVAFQLLHETGTNANVSILGSIGFAEDTDPDTEVEGTEVEYLTRKITITAGDGSTTSTEDKYLKLYSVRGDHLFSKDTDLQLHEPDILKWVSPGRNSFLDTHRAAQQHILDTLYHDGIVDDEDNRLTKAAIVDTEEVRVWAKYVALRMIFEGRWNSVEDVLFQKYKNYRDHELNAKNAASLKFDFDGDGEVETGEVHNMSSVRLSRR